MFLEKTAGFFNGGIEMWLLIYISTVWLKLH